MFHSKSEGLIKVIRSELSKDLLIVLSFTLFAVLVLSSSIHSPFKMGDHDGAGGCHWGTIARNYIRYGYSATKFGMVENGGLLTASEFRYHTHHPPLTAIILSLGLKIFGIHEWSIRFVFILFAVGVLGLFYFFSKELWNRRVAVLSSLFMLFTPMYLHFSSAADMVSIALFFSIAAIYSYARWLKTGSVTAIITLSIMFLLAVLSSWEAYYLIPAILYHNFLRDKKRGINVLIPALGILSLCIYLIHTMVLIGSHDLMSNIRWAIYRTGLHTISQDPLFMLTYIKQIFVWIWFLFTPPVAILALLFSLMYLRQNKEERLNGNYDFVALFLVFGALKYLLFINLCYYHSQRLYYFVPFFALSASLATNAILKKAKQPKIKALLRLPLICLMIATPLFITRPVFELLHENDMRNSFKLSSNQFHYEDDAREFLFYEGLKEHVQKKLGPQDMVLTNRWVPQFRFYLDRNTNETISSIKRLEDILETTRSGTASSKDKKKMLFIFVDNGDDKSSDETKLLQYLENNYSLIKSMRGSRFLIFDLNK